MISEDEALRREEERLAKAMQRSTLSPSSSKTDISEDSKSRHSVSPSVIKYAPKYPQANEVASKTEFTSERTLISFDLKGDPSGKPEISLLSVQTSEEVQITVQASVYDERVTIVVIANQIKFVCQREQKNDDGTISKIKTTTGIQLNMNLTMEGTHFTPLPQQGVKVHIKKPTHH